MQYEAAAQFAVAATSQNQVDVKWNEMRLVTYKSLERTSVNKERAYTIGYYRAVIAWRVLIDPPCRRRRLLTDLHRRRLQSSIDAGGRSRPWHGAARPSVAIC